MEDTMGMLEGWKQVADFLGYTEKHAMRLFKDFLHILPAWRGRKTRVRLSHDELRVLIKAVREHRKEVYERTRIYFIGDDEMVKIGITTDVARRLYQLKRIKGRVLKILHVFEGSLKHERQLHERFKKYALGGEWFLLSPEVLEFINLKPEKVDLDVA